MNATQLGLLVGMVAAALVSMPTAASLATEHRAMTRAFNQNDTIASSAVTSATVSDDKTTRAASPLPVRPLTYRTDADNATIAEPVRWGRRAYVRPYYGRTYGVYYGRDPRFYSGSGYRGYYRPGPRDYRFYGTPRYGYYQYPYGSGARVGGTRFYWR